MLIEMAFFSPFSLLFPLFFSGDGRFFPGDASLFHVFFYNPLLGSDEGTTV